MLYLSSILDKPVKNEIGDRIGKVRDMMIEPDKDFPPVIYILMNSRGKMNMISWSKIKHIDSEGIILLGTEEQIEDFKIPGEWIYLRRDVLDKQIVDMDDHRVVRVNDIQLNRVGNDIRVAGVDVGTPGLLRRMGLLQIGEKISQALKLKTPMNIIPWDMVNTLGRGQTSSLKLSTNQQEMTKLHPADLADILEDLSGSDRRQLFDALDTETAAEALEQMEEDVQIALFKGLSDEKAADLLEEMSHDEAADLLQDLPEERANALLGLMDTEEAEDVKELLIYEEDTAGGFMNNEFVSASPHKTCTDTINLIRELSPETELVYYIYVAEDDEKLIGVLSLRDLIVASPSTMLKDMMHTTIISVPLNANIEQVTELIEKYDLLAVPVVDEKFRIKGIVTVDDVMEYILPRAGV